MSSQRVKLKDQILDGVARSVKEIQAYSFSSDGEVVKINNEARPLQRLVEHIDHAFLHGLKHITPGYWIFVKLFTHKLLVSDILALDRLATDLGRSRAWLYQALNEGLLESYLRCFLDNAATLRKFYIEHALVRDSERLALLMTLVSGLDFVTFDLELNVAYFDLVSHIPRSASNPRDLDDTISIHSNLSIESASSSVVADGDGSTSLCIESGTSFESSHDVIAPCGGEEKGEEHLLVEPPVEAIESAPTTQSLPEEPDSQDNCDSQEVVRPLTLDVPLIVDDKTLPNSGSDQLKYVARNYTTPDFDINMEKVAEQDQSLEVIRIRKKNKKKKKRKAGPKGSHGTRLDDGTRVGGRDRSASPSTVSIASSCIEESEMEDKESFLGPETGDGSLSSVTNISECSAVEDDLDSRVMLASSLPESEHSLTGLCFGNVTKGQALENMKTVVEDHKRTEDLVDGGKGVAIECAIVMNEILERVCNEESGPRNDCYSHSAKVMQGGAVDGSQGRTEQGDEKIRLRSLTDLLQDSLNLSTEVADQSVIYWQGEATDNSFDAEASSMTPVKARSRGLPGVDMDSAGDEVFESPRGQESVSAVLPRSTNCHRGIGNRDGCSQSTAQVNLSSNSAAVSHSHHDQRASHIQSGSVDATAKTLPKDSSPHSLSVVPKLSQGQDSPDSGFVQSNISTAITTRSSDSLSSGVGSIADTSATGFSAMSVNSDLGSQEDDSHRRPDNCWQCSSGISLLQSAELEEDGFVVVDVVEDEGNVSLESERHRGDGQETNTDPLHALDLNANSSPEEGPRDAVTMATGALDDGDEEIIANHEAEMKVDNNLKLYLMLDIFKIQDEKFHKLLRMSTGHMEGNLIPAFILLTDLAIYILRRGEHNGRFSLESRILYSELDYVLIGLNYQSVQVVCKNRRKQFWLTTGSETLTRFFLYCVRDVMRSNRDLSSLCVLTDATAQAIGLKKYVSNEEKVEMCEASIHLYSLVHWEDLLDSSTDADLQLYLPATKRKGLLHYKTKESFFVGSYWKSAYFKLKHSVLKRYSRKDEEPDLTIELGSPKFGGCRRVHHSDRKFCFELIFTNGSAPLQLACQDELQLSHWLQSICEVVAQQNSVSQQRGPQPNPCQPACAALTSRSLILCLEDHQTHFFRTLARTGLSSISLVERSTAPHSYVLINFRNSECDNPWVLYFNCSKELDKFLFNLSQACQQIDRMHLKVREVKNEKLRQRCGSCQELIMSAWQRSDSLERGRVRGDTW